MRAVNLHGMVTILNRSRLLLLSAMAFIGVTACGGGGGYGGGNAYSSMSSSSSASSVSSSSSSTGGATSFSVAMATDQVYPVPNSTASANATLLIDTTTGMSSGSVTLNGITATAITINDAYAGNNGPSVLTLAQSAGSASTWSIGAGATLTAAQLNDLLAGKLYVLVTSSTFPNGALRGQIVPANIRVVFAPVGGAQESPAVSTTASGVAAVTVNTATMKAAVDVNTTGVNTALGAEILASFVGSSSSLAILVADNSTPGRWLNENITLSDTDLANFDSSRWYVNVYTNAHPGGEIRGQFAPNAPTLSALQANIFTPICSGCHSGAGSTLPSVQNLTTASSTFAAVVNVASIEQASVVRIRPYDPDNSYLVRKIQGDPSIGGSRMPLGGQLTQTQIDQIRAWSAAGAKNN